MEKMGLSESKKNNIVVSDLFNDYFNFIDVSLNSALTYKKAIKRFKEWLENNNVSDIKKETIISYKSYLIATYKPKTAQLYLVAVKLFFEWLEEKGLYKNVAKNVKGIRLDNEHVRSYLNEDQCKQLLTVVKGNYSTIKELRDYAIISLMLTTGLRTIEIVRANVEDLANIGNSKVLHIQGKGRLNKTDYVKLSENVETAINNYLKACNRTKGVLFTSCSNNSKECLTTKSISRIVKGYLKDIGLNSDRFTAHSLRHTTAHLNLNNGGTAEETQTLLRHKNITTTYIYIHEIEREKNISELRISNVLFN